ncbi:hypothetical protein MPSEU_000694100 [Mayamaea pseudoterrestris]|nr:hypothetical protein MPSEU_000694100 [Mayamaea pseudoterrestris]
MNHWQPRCGWFYLLYYYSILLLILHVDTTMASSSSAAAAPSSTPWASGLSQTDLMLKDSVLVVDNNDNIIGSASKQNSHVFSNQQPHGVLHRAFSVFLFDKSTNKLLLQQRASHKITFPNVWTNTCCSHPLHGMEQSEVDLPKSVIKGQVNGVKHAAIRKLQHELGIRGLSVSDFHFVTRLHYWAADTVTHGPNSPWGEHEIDYVLFVCVDNAKNVMPLHPNDDEVSNCKWVSMDELKHMFQDKKLLFSPWFRLICEKWLWNWWSNLDATMAGRYDDYQTICEFDPPAEHFGGAGNAQALFTKTSKGDVNKKQGAYGKVTTHKESTLVQLVHVDEVFAALTILYLKPLASNLDKAYIQTKFPKEELAFCNDILVKVSRSFAAVIQQLPPTLLVDILIFYLVLRALDTIEDDTKAFESHAIKIKHLRDFTKNALGDETWRMDGVGENDERRLLQEFPKAHAVFACLQPASQQVIRDITQRMAQGMAEFVGKDLGQGTKDVTEYNRYCHFVAGLVGEGLSRLFAASGLEQPSLAGELKLSDQMGLFLQKTNIIRDYLEDYVDKRAFWPQSIWKKYSATGELGYFADPTTPEVQAKALECLNELVTDALELVPDCLAYMDKLECAEVFRFCAIPQVMAIATLAKCYSNLDVFTGVVKIRKGLSCKLLLRTNNIAEVHNTFYSFAQAIINKAKTARSNGVIDPTFERTKQICEKISLLTDAGAIVQRRMQTKRVIACGALLGLGIYYGEYGTEYKSLVKAGLAVSSGLLWYYGPWTVASSLKDASVLQPEAKAL